MSKKEKIILMIRMGAIAYLVWGVGGYLFDKALFSSFMQTNALIANGLIAVALHNFKGSDASPPPPSQPTTTESPQ